MQVHAIYDQGQLQFEQPLRLKHQRFRLVVNVPDEEIDSASDDEMKTLSSTTGTRQTLDGILGSWKRQLQDSPPTTLEDMARLQIEALEEKHLGSR